VTDAELVDRARQGDHSAFGELMDRHAPSVYRTALAAVGSPAEADDVVQEAFWEAYRALARFRGDASFRTWISAITWKRGLNRRRWLRLQWRRLIPMGEPGQREPVATEQSAEAQLVDDVLGRVALDLVRTLPPKLRDPLLLAATEQHSYAEIAMILGIPEGTVKWRVAEAKKLLRRKMAAAQSI
jgi:RNA polymerase sigma-70 factor (ECF subfamily)